MADLGNIGRSMSHGNAYRGRSPFTLVKQPTSVDATASDSTANAVIQVSASNGTRVDAVRADGTGEWHVYDLDDGTYYAYEVGSSKVWSIVVSGSSATVTALSSATGTVAFASIG